LGTGKQLKAKTFNRLFETIQRLREIKVTDHQGNSRILHYRYKSSYPCESNEWGDFQTHRRVLGLISIGEEINTILNYIPTSQVQVFVSTRSATFMDDVNEYSSGDDVESGEKFLLPRS
jgi:hypothetical protein